MEINKLVIKKGFKFWKALQGTVHQVTPYFPHLKDSLDKMATIKAII